MRHLIDEPFGIITDLIRLHAQAEPARLALRDGSGDAPALTYGELDAAIDRVAASLQAAGVTNGDAIAVCALTTATYGVLFLGALRAGINVVPLPPSATPPVLARMVADASARLFFIDASVVDVLTECDPSVPRISLDDSAAGTPWSSWLAPVGSTPTPVTITPASPFNIIYSSGTTGIPKGIVQPHAMRWSHVQRHRPYAFGPDAVTILATPLYSNTTLIPLFTTLAFGGCVITLGKFNVAHYLELCQRHGATHTMLVPVQYQRIMAHPEFGRYDLTRFRFKFATSAPFPATLKADVLARWPGGLVEVYGLTEGGGSCLLEAHRYPDKLHTVGKPAPGSDFRLIDDNGVEIAAAPGVIGELVGHSRGMMNGYHGQPEKTREAEWFAPDGKRYIRTGDVGRFDEDGFLTLLDRKKDMIITGGFNVYARDLEDSLYQHPAVLECAVIGMPSEQWGETPVAFVVPRPGASDGVSAEDLRGWLNAQVGKVQRLSALHYVDSLPRSAIGKVLKTELRARYARPGA